MYNRNIIPIIQFTYLKKNKRCPHFKERSDRKLMTSKEKIQEKIIMVFCIALSVLCIAYIAIDYNTNPQYGLSKLKIGFEQSGYNIDNIDFVRTEIIGIFRASEPIRYEKDGQTYEYWEAVQVLPFSRFSLISAKYIVRPYDKQIKPSDWKKRT